MKRNEIVAVLVVAINIVSDGDEMDVILSEQDFGAKVSSYIIEQSVLCPLQTSAPNRQSKY